MLGIVIGVGAVIAMIALGTGAKKSVQERIAKLGTTLLQVNPQRVAAGRRRHRRREASMTMDDVKLLEERASKITAIQPQQDQRTAWCNTAAQNTMSSVTGTTANFLEVRKYKLAAGRMFTSQEDDGRRRVTVLGAHELSRISASRIPRRSSVRWSASAGSSSR